MLKIVSGNENKIAEKLKSPSISVSLEPSDSAIKQIAEIIADVNAATENHNRKIDNKTTALAEIKNIFWDIMRWEYDQTILSYTSDKKNLDSEKANILEKCRKVLNAAEN